MLVEVNRTFGGSKAGNVVGEFDQHAIRLTEADAEIHMTTFSLDLNCLSKKYPSWRGVFQLAEKRQQLPLFGVAESTEPLDVPRLLVWHHLVEQGLPLTGKVEPLAPPGDLPLEQPSSLKLLKLVGDVPFGNEQPVGELVLNQPGSCPDMGQDVELHHT